MFGLALFSALGDAPLSASSRPHTPLTVSIARAEIIAAVRVLSAAPPSSQGQESGRVDATLLPLDRINAAEPGWGYKERLDFRYYPMAAPGEYAISAVGRFFHAGTPIVTRVLRVWVE